MMLRTSLPPTRSYLAPTAQIREAFAASDETYGMPRIRAELQEASIVASRKRIARLMRLAQMRGVSRRRSLCVTTERDMRHRPAPDLVKREFVATSINQLWVADWNTKFCKQIINLRSPDVRTLGHH